MSIVPEGNELKSKNLKEKLSSGTNTDMKNWHFIHLPDSKSLVCIITCLLILN